MVRSRKGIIFLVTLFIVGLFAVACGADATATPRPTNTPAPAATATPTLEPGETPQPTATPRPAATATPVPEWKPTKRITWIVPYSPGGGFDSYSRGIAELLNNKYLPDGIEVIVKNTPGAEGRTGLLNVWRSRPDGHTIGIVDGSGAATFQALKGVEEAGYDIGKIPFIGNPVTEPLMLSANVNSSIKNAAQLRDGGEIPVVAVGNSNILQWIVLSETLNFTPKFITGYNGSAEMMIALARGDGELGIMNVTSQLQFMESGDITPLVVFSDKVNVYAPDAKPAKEAIGEEIFFSTTRPIGISPETPDNIVAWWRGVFDELLVDPEFIAWGVRAQRPIKPESGAQSSKVLQDQVQRASAVKDKALAVFDQLGQ
jgi:tripartite-type tricarboxylate transporter receptor subunit TctC